MEVAYIQGTPAAIGPYSQAMISKGFVFTFGKISIDFVTEIIAGDSIEVQIVYIEEQSQESGDCR